MGCWDIKWEVARWSCVAGDSALTRIGRVGLLPRCDLGHAAQAQSCVHGGNSDAKTGPFQKLGPQLRMGPRAG
jgi:hypothetical protein